MQRELQVGLVLAATAAACVAAGRLAPLPVAVGLVVAVAGAAGWAARRALHAPGPRGDRLEADLDTLAPRIEARRAAPDSRVDARNDALAEVARRFQRTFELAPVGIAHVALDGRWLRMNERCCEIVGYTREELRRRTFQDVTHADDLEAEVALHRRLQAGEIPRYTLRKRCWHKGGRLVWVDLTVATMRGVDGVPEHAIAILQDVTDQVAAERALEASELRYRSLVDASSAVVCTVAPSGAFVDPQPSWCRYTGQDAEACRGLGYTDAFHPEDRAALQAAWARSARTGATFETAGRLWNAATGAYRHFTARAVPIRDRDTGEIVQWFGMMFDTEEEARAADVLRRAHEELERRVAARTAELERSNQELEAFAYVASHDLQEPLRMIASFARLIEDRHGGALDAEGRSFLGFVRDGAKRMQTLIDELLALSRVGRQGRRETRCDLHEIARASLTPLRDRIEATGARIEIEPLPTIVGSPSEWLRLFQNLVANALRYAGDAPPRVRVFAESRPGELAISVRDEGIGIDPAHHERIFGAFQRLHGREDGGVGMGLAICRKIVEVHGGRIGVASAPGEGATITITLPERARAAPPEPGKPEDEPAA